MAKDDEVFVNEFGHDLRCLRSSLHDFVFDMRILVLSRLAMRSFHWRVAICLPGLCCHTARRLPDSGPVYAATPLCGTDKQRGQMNVVCLWPGLGWTNGHIDRGCRGRGMYLQTSVAQ